MRSLAPAVVFVVFAASAQAATIPGFRVERAGAIEGFPTSLAADSSGRLYYTTTDGRIYRFDTIGSTHIVSVETEGTGNSGLLGMALRDDNTAVVHYTTPNQTYDVISAIDLRDGSESVIHRFIGDVELPGRPTPDEHHGGNPTIARDGTIFVGIGDYSWSFIAPNRDWNGGKIMRIAPDGTVTQFARGLRNPFDMAWDEETRRLVVSDNGPIAGDEIHIIDEGSDLGWPHTWGTLAPVSGAVPPDYVFPFTTAPTGMVLLGRQQAHMRGGFLVASFVARTIYYFPSTSTPLAQPFKVVERETSAIIDLAQTPDGKIFFITGGFSPGSSAIYRLYGPKCGDCDGDGSITTADYKKLIEVLADGVMRPAKDPAQSTQSWGCDVDEDGFLTAADAAALMEMLGSRRRAAAK